MTEAEQRATVWLMAWDSQGIHRTGGPGDESGADWLAAEVVALGASPVMEAFPFDRIDPVETFVEIDGIRIAGVPVFDAPPTDGVAGALGLAGSGAPIAVAELSPRVVYTQEWRNLRSDPTQHGLVVICQGDHPGRGLLNAEQCKAPHGAPALHVSSEAREAVLSAVARGAVARLVARRTMTRVMARNVVVTLPGVDRSRPPVVVMTPRSSWWQSTAERGGGIVCWLETLRALLEWPPVCDVVLTANTGHELGHIGLDDFQERRPGWDRPNGATWVHYGANIGAVGGRLSIMSAADDLRVMMAEALRLSGQPADDLAPPTLVPSGETRDIHRAGGRYLTLVGSNPLFHLPQDRWPDAVDIPTIVRLAAGASTVVVRLTR